MDDDEILYHYTTIAGLHGILRGGRVWASDCRYLNDDQELANALNLFLRRLHDSKRAPVEEAFYWHNFSRAHCVFSLSRSPRVLSQWRAYADDGRGAAIGFRRKFLIGYSTRPVRHLVDCVYEGHDEFVDNLLRRYEEEIDRIVDMHKEAGAANTFMQLLDANPQPLEALYGELLKVKNAAFTEEQEVRLIINVPKEQVSTRVARGLIVPYVEHAFIDDGDVDAMWCVAPELWLGPRCDKRNIDAIGAFQQFGWQRDRGIYRYDCGYV